MLKKLSCIVIILGINACSSVATQSRDDSYYAGNRNRQQAEDLFASQGDMADREIKAILEYRLQLPPTNRIAILHLSHNPYWQFYSHDFAQLTDDIAAGFIGELRTSSRVYDASYLPALLVPEKRTLPYLRAAAARYQADLLLLYRDQCGSFEKYRLFKADQTRAYCSVEAVLLDIRSGIVPFTAVATESFSAAKVSEEKSFRETIKKVEFQALSRALARVALDLNNFLEQAG